MDPTVEFLARIAADYPFVTTRDSFVYADGRILPLLGAIWSREGRTPVIAYGSNRSPEALRRKFEQTPGTTIPTIRARLSGFDVVYAAMVSSLGPVPATLCPSPGSICEVAVQFLTGAQLERMHNSERLGVSYGWASAPAAALEVEEIGPCQAGYYYCLHGILRHEGGAVALAEINCENREFLAMRQPEMIAVLQRRLQAGNDQPLTFLAEHIQSDDVRKQRIEILKADAIQFGPAASAAV
jgi:hypothetical protein